MNIENQLNNIVYNLTGVLSYGNLRFNYNSTSMYLSELDLYCFDFMKDLKIADTFSINNIFNEDLYYSIQNIVTDKKYTKKQTHISDTYKYYEHNGIKIIVPVAKWYDFLIINDASKVFIISKKGDYSIFILRDLIKSTLENDKSVLFHSASIIKDEKSMLIIGNKGAGKSTFAFGMANAFDYKLISNDRTYLNSDYSLTSFPIDIRLGRGTVANNSKLKNMVINHHKFGEEFLLLNDDSEKIIVFPSDINSKITMLNGSSGVKLSHIIIPQFDKGLSTGNLHLAKPKNIDHIRHIILENCLTPDDPIWICSLLENDKHSKKELKDIANARIDDMLKKIKLYTIRYRDIRKDSKIIKEK